MTETIEQTIEQIKTVIEWADNSIRLASTELTDEQFEAIEFGYLQDELTDLKTLADKLKFQLWEQSLNN